jgi:NAD(P)-dependent dehydrogenase (short-subunit alcohol dehydrogenase family)
MWALDAITATPTSAYSAAQAGRHALTKNLAVELAPHGIRVNTVALAFVATPAYERFMTPEEARDVLDSVASFHPLGRHGFLRDVVEAILFYESDCSSWITARRCRSTVAYSQLVTRLLRPSWRPSPCSEGRAAPSLGAARPLAQRPSV